MFSEYGLDLIAEWQTLSARRLWVLIKGLPTDAAVWREENIWTLENELAASHLETTHALFRVVLSGLGGEQIPPLQIERPNIGYDEPKEQRRERVVTTDSREIAAWFAAHH